MAEVTVDVGLDTFDTDDLIEELEWRGYHLVDVDDQPVLEIQAEIAKLAEIKRMSSQDFDYAFDNFVWDTIGKVL